MLRVGLCVVIAAAVLGGCSRSPQATAPALDVAIELTPRAKALAQIGHPVEVSAIIYGYGRPERRPKVDDMNWVRLVSERVITVTDSATVRFPSARYPLARREDVLVARVSINAGRFDRKLFRARYACGTLDLELDKAAAAPARIVCDVLG